MSTTQPVTPIRETVEGALRNALQIAGMWGGEVFHNRPDTKHAFRDIARLIRHALEQLSEPNLAAVQATEILVREWHGSLEERQNARDVAAGILHAQLSGIVPKTWERE